MITSWKEKRKKKKKKAAEFCSAKIGVGGGVSLGNGSKNSKVSFKVGKL